jgi:hypothetical protein
LDFNSDKSTKKTLQSEHSGSSEATWAIFNDSI